MPCPQMLTLRNHQRRRLDMRRWRRITQALLAAASPRHRADLGIYIVTRAEITRLNEAFLHHQGPTDVIAFDYSSAACGMRRAESPLRTPHSPLPTPHSALLWGEIFICLDEAVAQARRFQATWQTELVRYAIHGLLHLLGHDDHNPVSRRAMKTTEDTLLRQLALRFDLSRIALPTPQATRPLRRRLRHQYGR